MNHLKSILKIFISIAILYFVFQKIDLPAFLEIIKGVNPLWMVVAFCSLMLSQYASSIRLHLFWRDIKLNISRKFNWHLYLLGMYYSLLLPSSIGGDGYKVYLLNQKYDIKKRRLVSALILDRLSGLLGLGIWLCTLIFVYLSIDKSLSEFSSYKYIAPAIIILSVHVGWLIIKHFFKEHLQSFWHSLGLSLVVQGLSLGACLGIMAALGIFKNGLAYLSLFLVSSVAAVIPITFGGAGARELTFLTGAEFLPINVNTAIALGLLFYLLNVCASLIGMYFSFTKKHLNKEGLDSSI